MGCSYKKNNRGAMKVINAKCKQCGKVFKCYGKYDSTLPNCDVHTPYKKEKNDK